MLIARQMTFAILSLSVFANTVFSEDQPVKHDTVALASGNYTLHLNVPKSPKDQRDLRRPAKIECDGKQIELTTTGLAGNSIKFLGLQIDGKIKLFVSEIENDSIVTFYLFGKTVSPTSAQGSITIMTDGKVDTEGTWSISLSKKAKNPD